VTAAGEAECQDLEGAQYTRCKNEWQLRKYDCIENNCFASKVCCDWQATQPIEDDGFPTEPIYDEEPVGTYPEPYDPQEPQEPYEPYDPEEPIGTYPDPDGPIDEIEQLARGRSARSLNRGQAPRYNRPRYGRNVRLGRAQW
jgi:hypothetical protein